MRKVEEQVAGIETKIKDLAQQSGRWQSKATNVDEAVTALQVDVAAIKAREGLNATVKAPTVNVPAAAHPCRRALPVLVPWRPKVASSALSARTSRCRDKGAVSRARLAPSPAARAGRPAPSARRAPTAPSA